MKTRHTLLVLLLMMATGCNDDSAEVARVAQQALRQQAEQNQEMARLNREVAKSTQRLVEADAEARQEVLAAQRDLQAQQTVVNEQRDALEDERRDIAGQRHTESLLAPILATLGAGLLCLLPVGVACLLLWHVNQSEAPDVSSLLIEDALSERPKLLIASPATKRIASAENAERQKQTA